MHLTFHKDNFYQLCDHLAAGDIHLKSVINRYGYPPIWMRPARFSTLVLIILEQQVSLASAYAAFRKLKEKIGVITPAKLLALPDEAMRECYFTRQKMGYVREIARAIIQRKLELKQLGNLHDDEARHVLKQHKGIGDWSADIYLIQTLNRTDIFPIGDLALVKSMKELLRLDPGTTKELLLAIADRWRPYRTVATMLLWHNYIQQRNLKLEW